MKKFILIALPLLIIAGVTTLALTQNDESRESRKFTRHRMSMPGAGVRMGVVLSDITPKMRNELKIESGVVVQEVIEDGPAEKAGIEEGDVLLKIDGKQISDHQQVRDLLRETKEAKPIDVQLLRDGKNITVALTPEERPMARMFRQMGRRNYVGIRLQELDSDLAPYFSVAPDAGVLITTVDEDSPAAKAGLKSGDVITKINGEQIREARDVMETVRNLDEDETAKFTVLRRGKQQTFAVKPERGRLRDLSGMADLQNLPDIREFDMPDIDTRELSREMEELQDELRDLRGRLPEIENNVRREMDELRRELDRLKQED